MENVREGTYRNAPFSFELLGEMACQELLSLAIFWGCDSSSKGLRKSTHISLHNFGCVRRKDTRMLGEWESDMRMQIRIFEHVFDRGRGCLLGQWRAWHNLGRSV